MRDAQGAVQAVLDALVRADLERGVQVAAYLDGDLVMDAWADLADPATGQLVDGETLFTAFSSTKWITATAVQLLIVSAALADQGWTVGRKRGSTECFVSLAALETP